MNEKFYALPEEKQSQILNAAYKVFAMNATVLGFSLLNILYIHFSMRNEYRETKKLLCRWSQIS